MKKTNIFKTLLLLTMALLCALLTVSCSDSDDDDSRRSSKKKIPATTIEEQVLLDEGGVVITAKEYVTKSGSSDGIKILIENNTATDLTFSNDAFIVNGHMLNSWLYQEVPAGQKSNAVIDLDEYELKEAEISVVGEIEIYFDIYDNETYYDYLTPDVVTIRTSNYDKMDGMSELENGVKVYDGNGVKIYSKHNKSRLDYPDIVFLVENESNENVHVEIEDLSINGFAMTAYNTFNVYAGKKGVEALFVFEEDLEENDIEKIEDLEFELEIYNNDYEMIGKSGVISIN